MIHLLRLFFSFKKSKTNFVVADSSLMSSEASPGREKRKVSVSGMVNRLGDFLLLLNFLILKRKGNSFKSEYQKYKCNSAF